MNRELMLYSLMLYMVFPAVLPADTVLYRFEDDRVLWKIDTRRAGLHIAATGKRDDGEFRVPGFALNMTSPL